MKKFRISLIASLLLLFSVSAFADGLPAKVQNTFHKMYPKATNVEWTEIGGGYTAEFIMNGQEIDVWFDSNGKWIMTDTDVESLEKVPTPVAEAFMKSIMASMRLKDVRIGTFPNHPTVILIEVEGYNSDAEYQLLYGTDGKLLKDLNVSELGGEIYPGLFE